MIALKIALIVIVSYFIGNLNAAIIISHFRGGNIRKAGSGNPGTMNMIRTYGKTLGVMTLVLDALKAVACCAVACLVMEQVPFAAESNLPTFIAGLAVTAGHIYPVTMKFKGGKGIACIIGVNFVVNPLVMGITLVGGIILIIICKIGTFGTFSMILLPLIIEANSIGGGDIAVSVLIFLTVALSLFAHRENIVRLFRGRENFTYIFKKKPKPEMPEDPEKCRN